MDYPGKVITKNQVTPSQTSASGVWTLDDAAAAVENNSWPVAGVPNPISRSLRFNSADSAYLNRTPASAGNRKTWTWSGWVKRCDLVTSTQIVFGAYTSSADSLFIYFSNNQIILGGYATTYIGTTAVYRDPSSWYHILLALDTTQATSSNRIKLYVNGVQVTAFSQATYPTQNADLSVNATYSHTIGAGAGSPAYYFNGYLTEINFIDGQALTPSSFGMTDPVTGAWIPIKYSGTYGTNGFYLNFSNNASTAALGTDYSGNSNTWTTNNFSVTAGAGNDSLTDVPTPWIAYNTTGDVGGVVRGNYCTLNAVNKALYQPTISNGNLNVAPTTTQYQNAFSTISVTSGKWYCEVLVNGTPNSANMIGVSSTTEQNFLTTNAGLIGDTSSGYGYYIHNGNKFSNATSTAYGNSIASGNIVGIALDLDNGKVWFSKNGTWQASGDPVAGTNAAFTGLNSSLGFFVSSSSYSGGATSFDYNFGQRPFAYTPPAGFLSLCTTNLPTPTILNGAAYMAATLYQADGANSKTINNSVNGVSMQPDLVWIKSRSNAEGHVLWDVLRSNNQLASNSTAAEAAMGQLTSLNSNGFTVGYGAGQVNFSTYTYVAWQWKANGSGSSNTAGTITSTVSVNTTSGVSIVTYTGNATSGATVGHGLGVAPRMIIVKVRSTTNNWPVYHVSTGNGNYTLLNSTAASASDGGGFWNNTTPSSSVITLGSAGAVNASGATFVAYCFAAVPGFSAFGGYTGNGSADGPFLYTGFRPRWVLTKVTAGAGAPNSWVIHDTARDTYNYMDKELFPDASTAEQGSNNRGMDCLSNGFKVRSADNVINTNGGTYIYAAFAENPFKYSNAR